MFAPEVIQTSSMDCGPAALKSLLEGHGISVSYGRLREACQTDIDGTSIDTIEDIAQRAGLAAEQVMVPEDHVVLAASRSLPAIAAVRSASGHTHFIVIWQRIGGLVQLMDPSRGRLWVSRRSLQNQLVLHSMKVSASAWREWAGSEDFLAPLRERLRAIGVRRTARAEHIALATASSSWPALALLDAATRMVASLQAARSVSRSAGQPTLVALLEASRERSALEVVPEPYWTVRPLSKPEDNDSVLLRGAVLVRAYGRPTEAGPGETLDAATVSPELAAAFSERPSRPLRDLFAIVRTEGLAAQSIAGVALVLAVFGIVFEAILLRSTLDVGAMLKGPGQGWWAGAALAGFAALLLTLEFILASAERRIGSHLEGRLRVAFLDKIPRLSDAYFQSRPIADMLERSHTVHTIRTLPRLGVRFARVGLELAVTAIALAWLNPGTAWVAAAAALAAAGIPLLGQSFIAERDLRTRTHAGALSRFHLDALRGRTALEAHGAASAIEGEHDRLLTEWAAAALSLQRASIVIEGAQMIAGFGLAAWMLLGHLNPVNTPALLLQAYWMLNLPALGYELALIAREYPSHRSTILRLLEPLGAPDALERAGPKTDERRDVARQPAAASVAFEHVSVRVGGHDVLDNIHLSVASGEHVAIIGTSGAGKSTLVGLLLGWHRASTGDVLVDGVSLTAERLDSLRRDTAWVDPAVHLWNAPLLDNLLYGTGADPGALGPVLDAAGLLSVVAKLPLGLATALGEAGALLSAGEAQRVRFGRALLRRDPRLVVLDEPFMGLEHDRRRLLLSHARQRWSETTMLYVTHDVTETRAFDRVLVVEHGRIVEDGDPRQLAHSGASRYRLLLQAHESTQNRISGGEWRRLHLEAGRVVHGQTRTSEQTA